ncbi:hypothetical protein [Streptomyces anulatus]|uniref:hypothetical protein n=1 Tax=Streptomyces anulatus TaxID=1892 RepID=UPI00343DAE4B
MLTEVALQHKVIPGIAEFARGKLPSPAATDDGDEWVDGLCWLYCGQRWTRVRIGPASAARIAATLMLAAEIDTKISSDALGHSDIRITRDSYQSFLPQVGQERRRGDLEARPPPAQGCGQDSREGLAMSRSN